MRWVKRLAVLAALAIVAVVGVSLLRGADTPPPPRLPDATPDAVGGPLEGTLAPTAGSFVGYRVRETVAGVGLNEAVGRTGRVDGTARIQRGRIVAARFETDTRTLRSDEARRDEALRDAAAERRRSRVCARPRRDGGAAAPAVELGDRPGSALSGHPPRCPLRQSAGPDPDLRAWVDAARARWEGEGGKDTLGFVLLTLRRG
jgi:hypothetical protein